MFGEMREDRVCGDHVEGTVGERGRGQRTQSDRIGNRGTSLEKRQSKWDQRPRPGGGRPDSPSGRTAGSAPTRTRSPARGCRGSPGARVDRAYRFTIEKKTNASRRDCSPAEPTVFVCSRSSGKPGMRTPSMTGSVRLRTRNASHSSSFSAENRAKGSSRGFGRPKRLNTNGIPPLRSDRADRYSGAVWQTNDARKYIPRGDDEVRLTGGNPRAHERAPVGHGCC